jgi:DNA-binding NtrC family response regulator
MVEPEAANILVVDDEEGIRNVVSTLLKTQHHNVKVAEDGEQALERLAEQEFDLVLSDVRMEPMDGITLLGKAKEQYPDVTFVMLTAYSSIDTAMVALKLGAFDYLSKPFKVDEMLSTVARALEYHKAKKSKGKPHVPTQPQQIKYYFQDIIAESTAMQSTCDMIQRVAPTDSPALITGESGTGKELLARAIHNISKRQDGPFMTINCAELPEPLLRMAIFGATTEPDDSTQQSMLQKCNGGTLLLEEIEDTSLSIQEELINFFQDKNNTSLDVRIIASSNIPLDDDVATGKFRGDLYQRLAAIPISIAPLRERKEDIIAVARHILSKQASEDRPAKRLDSDVVQILEAYDWPGNARELKNVLTTIIDTVSERDITKAHLPPKIASTHTSAGDAAAALDATRGKELRSFLKMKAGLTPRK